MDLGNIPDVEPIVPEEQPIYAQFFAEELELALYANSWAYITQACRDTGNLGHRFYDQQTLISIGQHNDHTVLVRPLGHNTVEKTLDLAQRLRQQTSRPVYLKHPSEAQTDQLRSKGFVPMQEYPWTPEAPLDDDTYPQLLYDIITVLEAGHKESNVRRTLARFTNSLITDERLMHMHTMPFKPHEWTNQIATATDILMELDGGRNEWYDAHRNMITNHPTDGISSFLNLGRETLGFHVYTQIGHQTVGWYANICKYQEIPGLSEAFMMIAFSHLRDQGYSSVLAGGSETESLHKFKMKFNPVELKQAEHLVLL
ncbi:hypothetical protein ACFL0V_01590 [Nanoarchaeota archaeon]